ncbi:MAG TPA: 2TM domain-containing protein, partial [Dehalococcoidia bacterium]|nr:2TM domain-containing protein [Dehalococcoidia bacterium]
MTAGMTDEDLYKLARQRVRDKKDLLHHFIVYAVVNSILVLAWAFATEVDHPWFIWVLIPWGIGVLIHFIMVVVFSGREMKIKEESDGQVGRKKGFYRHLGLYLIVNIILIIVWARTGAEADPVPWFIYPLGGWGIFVVWNYLEAFVLAEEMGWEKRLLEKEVEKLR